MTDTTPVHTITKLLFQNMQPNLPSGSVEKLKTSIMKYDTEKKRKENQDLELIMNYKEKYESKRNIMNEMYEEYVRNRKVLLDRWKNENQLDALYELLKMKFDFQKIDDIYTAFHRNDWGNIKTEDNTDIILSNAKEDEIQVEQEQKKNIEIVENKKELHKEKVKKPRTRVPKPKV